MIKIKDIIETEPYLTELFNSISSSISQLDYYQNQKDILLKGKEGSERIINDYIERAGKEKVCIHGCIKLIKREIPYSYSRVYRFFKLLLREILSYKGIVAYSPYEIILRAEEQGLITNSDSWYHMIKDDIHLFDQSPKGIARRAEQYLWIFKDTKRKLYEMELPDRLISVNQKPKMDSKIEKILAEIVEGVKYFPYVEKIYLFGARARGHHSDRTDIDIAIDCPTATFQERNFLRKLVYHFNTVFETYQCSIPIDDKEALAKEKILLYQKEIPLKLYKPAYSDLSSIARESPHDNLSRELLFNSIQNLPYVKEVYTFKGEDLEITLCQVPFAVVCPEATEKEWILIELIFRTILFQKTIVRYDTLDKKGVLKGKIDSNKILLYRK